jgi:hypothetical protein
VFYTRKQLEDVENGIPAKRAKTVRAKKSVKKGSKGKK